MRLRLIKKLAERIDGIDLSAHGMGDVIDLPRSEARLLMAEGWAVHEPNQGRRSYSSVGSTKSSAAAVTADRPKRRPYKKGSIDRTI